MFRTSASTRAFLNLTVLAAALLGSACSDSSGPSEDDGGRDPGRGGNTASPGGNGGGTGGTGSTGGTGGTPDHNEGFQLTNLYPDVAVWYVFAWECGTPAQENDLLGAEEVIAPGETRTFLLAPGCYELAIVMADGDVTEGTTEVEEGYINQHTVEPDPADDRELIGDGDTLLEDRASAPNREGRAGQPSFGWRHW